MDTEPRATLASTLPGSSYTTSTPQWIVLEYQTVQAGSSSSIPRVTVKRYTNYPEHVNASKKARDARKAAIEREIEGIRELASIVQERLDTYDITKHHVMRERNEALVLQVLKLHEELEELRALGA